MSKEGRDAADLRKNWIDASQGRPVLRSTVVQNSNYKKEGAAVYKSFHILYLAS